MIVSIGIAVKLLRMLTSTIQIISGLDHFQINQNVVYYQGPSLISQPSVI